MHVRLEVTEGQPCTTSSPSKAFTSPSQLSKLEAGEHDPQWSTVERVLKALAPGEAMDPLTLLQQLENDLT